MWNFSATIFNRCLNTGSSEFQSRVSASRSSLLQPRACAFCRQTLDVSCAELWRSLDYGSRRQNERAGEYICRSCLRDLPLIFPWRDVLTRQTISWSDLAKNYCFDRSVMALTEYKDPIKRSLLQLKFHGDRSQSLVLAEILEKCLPLRKWRGQITFVPVPLSEKRLHERGYNQVTLILEQLTSRQPIEIVNLLKKIRDTERQSELQSTAARKANIHEAFAVDTGVSLLKTDRILLFDDVVTTAATLLEAKRTLNQAGYQHVCCLALTTGRI